MTRCCGNCYWFYELSNKDGYCNTAIYDIATTVLVEDVCEKFIPNGAKMKKKKNKKLKQLIAKRLALIDIEDFIGEQIIKLEDKIEKIEKKIKED